MCLTPLKGWGLSQVKLYFSALENGPSPSFSPAALLNHLYATCHNSMNQFYGRVFIIYISVLYTVKLRQYKTLSLKIKYKDKTFFRPFLKVNPQP